MAAISRGLHDAGLPSRAQQSTEENAEDMVLKDSVDLTLGKGNQDKPSSTLFTSATVSLSSRIPTKLKSKIWADEYFDLGALLTPSPEDTKYSVSVVNDSSQPRLCLELAAKATRISTIHQWVSAFNSFIAVYTEKQPSAVADLLKYVEVVWDIASKGGNW